jgi:hypothetical protein
VLRLYVQILGVSRVLAGVAGAFTQGIFKVEKTSLREAAAEDVDEVLAAEGLRHEFPALARFGVAGECGFDHRRRVEFGLHGFGHVFDGLLKPAEAGFFFLDAADGVVDMAARGFGKGIEKFLQAFGLAEFAGGMDGHGDSGTYPEHCLIYFHLKTMEHRQ